jgi:curved DNA-binding protein CbpA
MKAADHYTTLGVPRDADGPTLKRAYRRKARVTHPDAPGGGKESFQRVERAYRVLKDPSRREAYDRFGEASEGTRSVAQQAEDELVAALVASVDACPDVAAHDVLSHAAQLLLDKRGKSQKAIRNAEAQVAKFRAAAGRLSRMGGESPLCAALEAKAEEGEAWVKGARFDVAKLDAALALAAEHSYRSEPPPCFYDGVSLDMAALTEMMGRTTW